MVNIETLVTRYSRSHELFYIVSVNDIENTLDFFHDLSTYIQYSKSYMWISINSKLDITSNWEAPNFAITSIRGSPTVKTSNIWVCFCVLCDRQIVLVKGKTFFFLKTFCCGKDGRCSKALVISNVVMVKIECIFVESHLSVLKSRWFSKILSSALIQALCWRFLPVWPVSLHRLYFVTSFDIVTSNLSRIQIKSQVKAIMKRYSDSFSLDKIFPDKCV